MAFVFEVVDARTEIISELVKVEGAASPEDAARRVLGIDVSRSGHVRDLAARVYWQPTLGGAKMMVRLYKKAI